MSSGYIYVLSNKSMPGLLKIGRTDRRPETRAKELTSATGVPIAFEIEFSVLVSDSIAAESFIHRTLETKGLRLAQNREFFKINLDQAIELLRQASVQLFSVDEQQRWGSSREYLSAQYDSIKLPGFFEQISHEHAERIENLLWPIAHEGFAPAYRSLAKIFLDNCPNQLKYRQYLLDYLDSRFFEVKQDWTKTSMRTRQEVGVEVANFLENLYIKGWFGDHDINTAQNFLLSADGYTYDGYIQQVNRSEFPNAIRSRALEI